ncbi:MAG: VCBS repeat-containing protein [Planctomycetes bacterium]|nr:VCBS repeat-containing protein [Planctomycetota bacterium]
MRDRSAHRECRDVADRTARAGITHSHQPPYAAGFAAGGAVRRFNRDGFQDLYLASGGVPRDRLYINNGDGTFSNRASQWGIAAWHRGTGGVVDDFDGDGWLDLFVTSLGPSGNDQPGDHRLYHIEHSCGSAWSSVSAGSAATPRCGSRSTIRSTRAPTPWSNSRPPRPPGTCSSSRLRACATCPASDRGGDGQADSQPAAVEARPELVVTRRCRPTTRSTTSSSR